MKELKQQLEKLENKMFMLQMIDHWSADDYRYSNELQKQIKEVKEKIKREEVE